MSLPTSSSADPMNASPVAMTRVVRSTGGSGRISPSPSSLSAAAVSTTSASGSGGCSDKITRFASPNRFDSLDAPYSFLDKRTPRNRLTVRLNQDRITSKATPERIPSNEILYESSVPQPYHSSSSAVVTPHRIVTTRSLPIRRPRPDAPANETRRFITQRSHDAIDFNKPHSRVTERLNTIEVRLQRMREQRADEHLRERRALLQHQIGQKEPHADSPLESEERRGSGPLPGQIPNVDLISANHQHQVSAPLTLTGQLLLADRTDARPPPSPVNPLPAGHAGGGILGRQRSPKQKKGAPPPPPPKPEITLVDSKVRTRVLIQSDVSTQAKTLTYNGSGKGHDPEHDSRLDELASRMGLLGSVEGKTKPQQPGSVKEEEKVVPTPAAPVQSKPRVVELPRKGSLPVEQMSKVQPPPPVVPGGVTKRGRSSILNSILRRMSPRSKRRSKSQSPTRASVHMAREASSDGVALEKGSRGGSGSSRSGNAFFKMFRRGRREKTPTKSASAGGASSSSGCEAAPSVEGLSETSTSGGPGDSDPAHSRTASKKGQTSPEKHPQNSTNPVSNPGKGNSVVNGSGNGKVPSSEEKLSRPAHLPFDSGHVVNTGGSASCTSSPLRGTAPGGDSPTRPTERTALTPPGDQEGPRYLNVALSAFGYGGSIYGRGKAPSDSHLVCDVKSDSAELCPVLVQVDGAKGSTEVDGQKVQMRPRTLPTDRRLKTSPPEGGEEDVPTLMTMSVYHRQCSNKEEDFAVLRRKRTRSSSEGKEARARSSLIMLAVAQASPRGKGCHGPPPNSPMTPRHPYPPSSLETRASGSCSPGPTTPTIRRQLFPPGESEISQSAQTASAVELTNGSTAESVRDGSYYLVVVDETEKGIWTQIERVEEDLAKVGGEVSEEVCGNLRTAAGKARLLIAEKFAQFRGLCQQNLASLSSDGPQEGTDLVTLSSDLEGFWEMVMLQVADVNKVFAQIDRLREAGWKMEPTPEATPSPATAASKPRRSKPSSRPSGGKPSAKDDTARAEARKRIQAARREALAKMEQQQQASNDSSADVIIF